MDLKLRRIVLFTANMETMTAFYRDTLGLKIIGREKGWVDFDAGACRIALHAGPSEPGKRPPKLNFYAPDVAAARAALVSRGAKFGKIVSTANFDMCAGRDPDGNPIALSARK
jgi:catechol 2,3-dioxygenase-like lactoylglutathione lyase family enzyme